MDWEEGVKILGSALGPVTSRETFLKKITASVLNLRIWLEEVLETSARYQLRMGWRTFVQICSGYKVASYEHERLEFNWVQKACVRLHWHNQSQISKKQYMQTWILRGSILLKMKMYLLNLLLNIMYTMCYWKEPLGMDSALIPPLPALNALKYPRRL